jgi:hypothetical protein
MGPYPFRSCDFLGGGSYRFEFSAGFSERKGEGCCTCEHNPEGSRDWLGQSWAWHVLALSCRITELMLITDANIIMQLIYICMYLYSTHMYVYLQSTHA